MPVGLLLAN